jgi:hypothetical protein
VTIDPHLAWGRFGLEAEFVLLALDGKPLTEMSFHERMSAVRLFQGGEVTYRPKGFKNSVTRTMELVFFEW